MLYYIVDVDGDVGHPTKKADMIRRWLKSGRAKIKNRGTDWMLVKITKKIDLDKTIPSQFRIGIDPGYLNIGYAVYKVTDTKIEKVLVGEAKLRTNQVTENLIERKMYRQNRRQHRRKNVKRKFGSCKFRKPVWKNRKKHPWQPTHTHLIQSHMNVLKKLFQLVPQDESHVVFEYSKFDTSKITNPTIKRWEYGKGPQYGFENVKNYVRGRDNYTCQVCKANGKDIKLEVHHIITRANHGSDTPDNMICLCDICHKKVQSGRVKCPKPNPKLYVASGVLNSVTKEIYKQISDVISTSKTYGYVTDAYRKDLKLEKTHAGDASIIALCDEEEVLDISGLKLIDNASHMYLNQFRRHVRNFIQRNEDRKYYDGKTCVAWNRNIREGQDKKKPSLVEFRKNNLDMKVISKSGGLIKRKENKFMLFRPGDLLEIKPSKKELGLFKKYFDVCRGWASTQGTITSVNSNSNIPKRYVNKYSNNSGLVLV
jgi:hypothetical protein